MHWLPTQERKYLPLGSYPDNLTIRLSNAKNNTAPGQGLDSLVHGRRQRIPQTAQLRARATNAASCRACWSREVKHVTYPKH